MIEKGDTGGFPTGARQWFDAIAARPATARAYALAAQINPAPVMDEAARKVLFGQDAAVVKRP